MLTYYVDNDGTVYGIASVYEHELKRGESEVDVDKSLAVFKWTPGPKRR